MIDVKEASKAFNDLFAEKIADLYLEFVKPFSIGRGKNYKKGNVVGYEIFSPKDLNEFKQKTGIKELPSELFDNEQFKKVFYFMGGQ